MRGVNRLVKTRFARLFMLLLVSLALLAGTAFWSGFKVAANHPVLLEGNCDSPVPGTTIVTVNTCGDFDGDGRIGTAEDTDGADRIFGTLKAALGPGTGAAAGTGANNNGLVLIVKSGRYAESVLIGETLLPDYPDQGTTVPGNVTIEAAPGVTAIIDAVLQGDPAGGNTARQAGTGIVIYYPTGSTSDRTVTLRNLFIRNFRVGVGTFGFNSILIDNCRFENNRDSGMSLTGFNKLVVSRSQFQGNGRRIPVSGPSDPGDGLRIEGAASAKVFDSVFSNNVGAGIRNLGGPGQLTVYKVASFFNGTDIVGPVTIAPNPNYAN